MLDFRYELLFGVTTADATFALNNRQLEYGLEPEERNRILSDFVSSNYGLHQREIFAAIVNEYTDWQSAAQHPVNIRDNTLEALTDANYVAPIVETGDYHSSLNARSWFYVFDYQTKDSYYKQVSLYLWGVPKRRICLLNKHQNKLRNQTLNIKQTKG